MTSIIKELGGLRKLIKKLEDPRERLNYSLEMLVSGQDTQTNPDIREYYSLLSSSTKYLSGIQIEKAKKINTNLHKLTDGKSSDLLEERRSIDLEAIQSFISSYHDIFLPDNWSGFKEEWARVSESCKSWGETGLLKQLDFIYSISYEQCGPLPSPVIKNSKYPEEAPKKTFSTSPTKYQRETEDTRSQKSKTPAGLIAAKCLLYGFGAGLAVYAGYEVNQNFEEIQQHLNPFLTSVGSGGLSALISTFVVPPKVYGGKKRYMLGNAIYGVLSAVQWAAVNMDSQSTHPANHPLQYHFDSILAGGFFGLFYQVFKSKIKGDESELRYRQWLL